MWLAGGAVHLGVYAHRISFGTKGYANLVQLAAVHHHVADAVDAPAGTLTFTVKSAHIYDTERSRMRAICEAAPEGGPRH